MFALNNLAGGLPSILTKVKYLSVVLAGYNHNRRSLMYPTSPRMCLIHPGLPHPGHGDVGAGGGAGGALVQRLAVG